MSQEVHDSHLPTPSKPSPSDPPVLKALWRLKGSCWAAHIAMACVMSTVNL